MVKGSAAPDQLGATVAICMAKGSCHFDSSVPSPFIYDDSGRSLSQQAASYFRDISRNLKKRGGGGALAIFFKKGATTYQAISSPKGAPARSSSNFLQKEGEYTHFVLEKKRGGVDPPLDLPLGLLFSGDGNTGADAGGWGGGGGGGTQFVFFSKRGEVAPPSLNVLTSRGHVLQKDYGLDCGLDHGLGFSYELSCSTTICFATWLERDL